MIGGDVGIGHRLDRLFFRLAVFVLIILIQQVRSERTGRVSFAADSYSSVTKIGTEKADYNETAGNFIFSAVCFIRFAMTILP